VNGSKINNMEKDQRLGQMVLNIRVIINKGRNMDEDCLYGLMEPPMKETLLIIISKERGYINGLMEGSMMETGKKIRCMEKGFLLGLIIKDTKGHTFKIEKKDLENSIGQMENAIKDNGKMESNMEREFF